MGRVEAASCKMQFEHQDQANKNKRNEFYAICHALLEENAVPSQPQYDRWLYID